MTLAPRYIARLSAANLKRGEMQITLSPLTVIIGPNGSGKTTIADTATLAALGYVPRLGKRPVATSALMGPGATLEVTAELSDGSTIHRAWKRTKKGMSKVKAPEADTLPVVCFDLQDFLASSPQERAAIIATRYGLDDKKPEETIIAAVRKVWADLPEAPKAAATAIKDKDFAAWSEAVEEWLAEEAKNATAAAKTMNATLSGLVALDDSTGNTGPGREVIAAAHEKLGAIKAAIEGHEKNLATLNEQAEETNQVLGVMEENGLPTEDSRTLAELEEMRRALTAEIATLTARHEAAEAAAKTAASGRENIEKAKALMEKKAEWLAANQKPEPLAADVLELTAESGEIDIVKYERAATATRLIVEGCQREKAAAIAAASNGEECSCCGAKKEHWSEAKTWEMAERQQQAAVALSEAELNANTAEAALAAAMQKLAMQDAAREAVTMHAAASKKWEEEFTAHANFAALVASLTDALPVIPEFSTEDAMTLADLERDAADAAEVIGDKQTRAKYDAARAEMQRITESQDSTRAAITRAYTEKLSAEGEAQDLEHRAKDATEAAAARDQSQKARAAAKEQEAKAENWKAALAAFRTALNAETVKIYKPLLDLARPLCAGCLPSELSNKGLDFGRYEGAHFVPFEAFSGSEQAVTVAAISAALAAKGQGILFVDEANNIDATKRGRFLRNLADAITDGTIAQAILLDNADASAYNTLPAMAGAKLHKLAA